MIYVAFEARWQGCRADGKRQRRRVQPLLAASRVDQSRENMSELAAWDSFYVIVGSAAGALIGLQFVVVTLIAQRPTRAAPDASAAFGTPTIVHFGAVLLLAFCSRAPWQSITAPAVLWGFVGCCGIVYAVIVLRRMRKQGVYEPEFEDWLFHVVLPIAAYE